MEKYKLKVIVDGNEKWLKICRFLGETEYKLIESFDDATPITLSQCNNFSKYKYQNYLTDNIIL